MSGQGSTSNLERLLDPFLFRGCLVALIAQFLFVDAILAEVFVTGLALRELIPLDF